MNYIKPKPKLNGVKVSWKITKQVTELLNHYAEYTGYGQEEIVNMVLFELRNDPSFKEQLEHQRNNKRALQIIYARELAGDDKNGENKTLS